MVKTGKSKSPARPRRGIWLSALFKLTKGLILLAVGMGALSLLHENVSAQVTHWIALLRVDPQNRRFDSGLKAVMQLQPLRYEYKQNNALGLRSDGNHIGFGAQAVQKVIPEAVTRSENGYLQVNNDPILWTMLNAIKEQQKEIEQLKGQ